MPPVSRDLDALAHVPADRDLVAEFLTTRSEVNAELAYLTLSRLLDGIELLALTNVRELLQDLPETPFHTGAELSMLARSLGYEPTGYSYRMRFEDDPSTVFGLEFVGGGLTCDLVVLHTMNTRYPIHGTSEYVLDPGVMHALITQPALMQRLLEAYEALGIGITPRFYMQADEYVLEHAAAAVEDLQSMM